MQYTIKGLKEFVGMEDGGFNLTLLCDGKKVATSIYGGDGGETMTDFDKKADEKVFKDFLKTLPLEKSEYFPEGLAVTPDIFIWGLIEKYKEEKQLKRWCKTKVVVKKKGAEEGVYCTFSRPYSKEFADKLRATRPEIIEIINERFLEVA